MCRIPQAKAVTVNAKKPRVFSGVLRYSLRFFNACRKRRDRDSNPGYACRNSDFQDWLQFDATTNPKGGTQPSHSRSARMCAELPGRRFLGLAKPSLLLNPPRKCDLPSSRCGVLLLQRRHFEDQRFHRTGRRLAIFGLRLPRFDHNLPPPRHGKRANE